MTPFAVRIVNVRTKSPPSIGHNRDPKNVEDTGTFYFRHDILDQLPDYLFHIKRMERYDPVSYGIYSKIGATLLPPKTMMSTTIRGIVDPLTLPSFSCVLMGKDEDNNRDRVTPRLLYYQKMSSLVVGVQASKAQTFKMTLFYSKRDEPVTFPLTYYVAVHDSGEVLLLREHNLKRTEIRSRRGFNRWSVVPTKQWSYQPALRQMAAENGQDVHGMAATCFSLLASVAPRMEIGFQVRCWKDGPRAVFNIARKRTPYFFKDRDLIVNENGRTKRIFHYVEQHVRADGRTVKAHVRGLRRFQWNGYNVHISIPEMTAPDLRTFTASGIEIYDENTPTGMVDGHEFARTYADVVEGNRLR